ncbi:cystathionine gamma-synthase [Echinimonas agarilytica]|uniref:Cystathionine gamma-synthase n=1 Tax=Echinimonas agarilytica TaxID=1215918 RepID=A0AA42B628_9GAMM|nr:cystathionine gamma-synthase [Echinimonas agarilytica]MCM2678322.1 cystathionine gamma-synthase [Echinimonas agarilytica]
MSHDKTATTAVRAGIDSDTQHGAVVPPIYLTSTYSFAGFDEKRQFDYSRSGNPTRNMLGAAMADLEKGAHGVVTACGTAACHLATMLLDAGDLLVIPHDCYGGTYRLFTNLAAKGHFRLEIVDQHDEVALAKALAQKPKMVWVESPSNPLMRLVDIAKISELSHQVDALVVVDNTFMSPALQQPLTLGADLVVHSTTKFVNGHSDVVGGCLIAKSEEIGEQIAWWSNCIGVTGAPFDSYLTLRGIRTLLPRIRQHEENAKVLVEVLGQHPKVSAVHYPGLESHPSHELAKRQQFGFGGMVAFELDASLKEVKEFLAALKLFCLAESLGGVESLIAHPATMTHAAMDESARLAAGITDNLLRLSVGIEHVDDLKADLDAAFAAIA